MKDPVHVLLVDDDIVERDALSARLKSSGVRCECVASGHDALSVIDWWIPLVVVIECELRDGSGSGLTHRLRAWAADHFRPLYIIVQSRARLEEVRERETFDAYHAKSAVLESLILGLVAS